MQFYDRALSRYNASTEKQKNYFDIAATLVLLMILLVMIYPAVDHILKLNKEIEAGNNVKTALEKKVKDLNEAQSNLEAVKQDLPLAQIALPEGSDFTNYLKKPLEKLASSHKLNIKAVQFSSVPLSDPKENNTLNVRDLKYNISLGGDYLDFTGFLKDFEEFIRTSEVSSLSLKKDGTSTTIIIDAKTHYLGLPLLTTNSNSASGVTP